MKSAAAWACVFVVLASCEGLCPVRSAQELEFTLRAKGLDILLKLSIGLCVAGV